MHCTWSQIKRYCHHYRRLSKKKWSCATKHCKHWGEAEKIYFLTLILWQISIEMTLFLIDEIIDAYIITLQDGCWCCKLTAACAAIIALLCVHWLLLK